MITVEPVPCTGLTLGIRPLFSTHTYGTPMAYLDNNHQLGYQSRAEWAESPSHVVTRAIQDAIAESQQFADVGNAADMTRPDLLLTGELRIYQENRTVEPSMAEVEVRLELRQATEPGSLWAETLRETEPLKAPTPNALAEAMTTNVGRMAERVATTLKTLSLPPAEREQEL
ncbi:MAG TPA: ABC-type transport auxiliary lipoprotein family protein [Candidatus Hydrogenedentes bacterium]|nr:ABC-type transport auxiliary lipoprotein family protein [Candidatus Hydrogenedentota bacterium]